MTYSVVIVTFNNQQSIKSCLDSVLKSSGDFEVIVVDNNSEDDTVAITRKYKEVKLIKSDKNLGFSKANNLGASYAKGEFLIFLNPDTKISEKDTLEKLCSYLESSQYGLIGPKLVQQNGQTQKSARNLPSVWRAIQEYIFGIKDSFNFYVPKCEDICSVESVVGACMAMRKELFVKVGGFNEKYFLYFEDLELCKNIRRLGYEVGYAANITVEHSIGVSGKNKDVMNLSLNSSKKYYGSFQFLLIQLISRLANKLKKI
jgi:N-acetylglucosaminyl-diphospho-decaprenol L-rhamnosyltransferase